MPETPRSKVYDAIDGERAHQDATWSQHGRSVGEFVLLLEQYTSIARTEWANEPAPEQRTLHVVRKIAAISVSCMEQHGAPVREFLPGER